MSANAASPLDTKRQRDNDHGDGQSPKRIKALDPTVVNKIAAGEIIVAPMHALKELIENAVDAGSTSLEIAVKDGGMKLLQITDNGHGIHRDDLSILCERFTTSKLKLFEDLHAINTYGFRGEALASISHVAHLTVTTRTVDSSCAWRAKYEGGILVPVKPGLNAEPHPIAGRQGTQIIVEDLFYNMPQRQKAFKSPSEEYAKILDVVGKYAIHCAGVAFACKKYSDTSMAIAVTTQNSTLDRVRQVYGSSVANDLMSFNVASSTLGFESTGLMSNANHHAKKSTLLLFVNHRLVDSGFIRAAVQRTYAPWLPKGLHPFVYLSIILEPARVDVNVHPTKREVNFLNEEDITEMICDCLRDELGRVDVSRTFLTQSVLPSSKPLNQEPDQTVGVTPKLGMRASENSLVRTDPSLRKITAMLASAEESETTSDLKYYVQDKAHMQIRLTSIKNLRTSVHELMHGGLSEIFSTHTFVGVVDTARRIAAVQSGVKLYLMDYALVCQEYFYQIGLTDFGNFGTMCLEQPLDIRLLVTIAAKGLQHNDREAVDLQQAPERVAETLVAKRAMLSEYFNMQVTEDGMLHSLPILVKGYAPSLAKLPEFLLRLGPFVQWHDEQDCFHTFLTELASFHVPEPIIGQEEDPSLDAECEEGSAVNPKEISEARARRSHICRSLEHVLFPAFRSRLIVTRALLQGVVEVANLKGLYRVFERC